MAIAQLLLNPESCGFRFYGSIDAMDSVQLPSVIFEHLQGGDIQDGDIIDAIGLLLF